MSRTGTVRKTLRAWKRAARKQGIEVTTTGGGHLRWENADGDVVITPASPGRGRAMMNSAKELERVLGLRVRP